MSDDRINWAKYRYHLKRRMERRNNLTSEQRFEYAMKRLESENRKIEMEFNKLFERYNFDENED